ncbi:MAG: competence/damage-inducible protein A [Deltaproteobacteria bacterium]|nr:MAG: competence/damage-inducible protein A [Deltaproteobacteria bacterium]
MSTAAILVIGNEILSAKVQDENGPFLARELRALGVELRRIETVPDEVPLIVDALRRCLSQVQWVFTSGGVGPTHDDVTIAAVSQAFGRAVVLDERTLQLLRAHFGEPLKPALRRLAEVPEGSRVEFHEGYLFPVISLENVVILPGVPPLLREGFLRIRDRFRVAPIHSRALYFTIGEGALAEHLDATVARFPEVAIGSYPRFDTADHRVKVTFDARDQAQVRGACEFLKARLPAQVIVREE